jgi:hypothetical protein
LGTAGAWVGSEKRGVTGMVHLIDTVSATLNFTGVQLELGSNATPFEHRSYGDELLRCQRYYYIYARGNGQSETLLCYGIGTTSVYGSISLPNALRATPSIIWGGSGYTRLFRSNYAGSAYENGTEADTVGSYQADDFHIVLRNNNYAALTDNGGPYIAIYLNRIAALDAEL